MYTRNSAYTNFGYQVSKFVTEPEISDPEQYFFTLVNNVVASILQWIIYGCTRNHPVGLYKCLECLFSLVGYHIVSAL